MKLTINPAGVVKDINGRKDLQFISDSQDVNDIKYMLGLKPELSEYDSFFVKVENGDYSEIYGMTGIIPYLYRRLDKIELKY
jgi:hypothetical protein